jgi:hypothetical protein
VVASKAVLGELEAVLDERARQLEPFTDLAEDHPLLARAAIADWEAAFQRYHKAQLQRDDHWRRHLSLEAELTVADFESDVYLARRGLPVTVGSTVDGVWALSAEECEAYSLQPATADCGSVASPRTVPRPS